MSAALLAIDESKVTPGVLGFLVIALLGVATYLLIRSMNRQIRRIDLPDDEAGEESTDGPTNEAGDGPGRVTGRNDTP